MGQYYIPTSLNKGEWVYSHDYDNGLKLMEHSYIGNNFVAVVEDLLAEGGGWCRHEIVWAGDYADACPGKQANLYETRDDHLKLQPRARSKYSRRMKYRYLVNTSKSVFVDLATIKADKDGLYIHPLPLLTCEGNGRGGGDFHGRGIKKVGSWARDRIYMTNQRPKGFKRVSGQFTKA